MKNVKSLQTDAQTDRQNVIIKLICAFSLREFISVLFSRGLSSDTFISQEAMILKTPCLNLVQFNTVSSSK